MPNTRLGLWTSLVADPDGHAFQRVFTEITAMNMQDLVPEGTVVERDDGLIFKILEDTTAHGCPKVEIRGVGKTNWEVGQQTYITLYLHQSGMYLVHPTRCP